jgi:hypothetical protein
VSSPFIYNPNPKKPYAPRRANDLYPTPKGLAQAMVSRTWSWLGPRAKDVLDPGAGGGVFGEVMKRHEPDATVVGVELDKTLEPHPAYDYWYSEDYLTWQTDMRFNLIIGNPPYSLAEEFIRKSFTLLRDEGAIVFLLRLGFLGGQARARGLWNDFHLDEVAICSRRPSFTGNGKTDGHEYAVFTWAKGWGAPHVVWLEWEYEAGDLYAKETR